MTHSSASVPPATTDGSPRFVVDAMLGRLARWLRAMGCDTLYPRPMPGWAGDRRLLALARTEDRILITRDRMLARLADRHGCLVRSEVLDEQLREIVDRLGLAPAPRDWLSRCLECNGRLQLRRREAVAGLVPDHVLATHAEFAGCPDCGRTYLAGSHADRMLARLARVLAAADG